MMNRFLSTSWLVFSFSISTGVAGCSHAPSVEEQNQAEGRYRIAVALLNEAAEMGRQGNPQGQMAKHRLVLDELLQAEKINPYSEEVHYLLGVIYFVAFREHAKAESHVMRALEIRKDDYPEAENLLGTILVDAGRPAEALPYFERARTNLLYRTPYYAEQEIGWAKHQLGRNDEAVAHLRSAIIAQPDLCGAYVKLADVEDARGQIAEAERALEDFLTRCDTDRLRTTCGPKLLAYGYYRIGMWRMRRGDHGSAAEALETCLVRFPKESVSAECEKTLRLVR